MSKSLDELPAFSGVIDVADQFFILDQNDGVLKRIDFGTLSQVPTNTQGDDYTAVLTDKGKNIDMTKASATNFTVPPNSSVPYPLGTVLYVTWAGDGQPTIVEGSGVTVLVAASKGLKIAEKYETIMLRKRGTDEWLATGALVA